MWIGAKWYSVKTCLGNQEESKFIIRGETLNIAWTLSSNWSNWNQKFIAVWFS